MRKWLRFLSLASGPAGIVSHGLSLLILENIYRKSVRKKNPIGSDLVK